jgi:transcriptional regulator with XRE-family HTH domain
MARNLPPFDPQLKPTVSDLPDLGKLVRNRRAKAKLRIDDAAALCGVSGDVLSRLENGKPVTADKLLLVLDGLGLRMLVVPTEDITTILTAPAHGAVDG